MKKSLGRELRRLRKQTGLTIEELGTQTKIPVKHLKNLEKERFGNLPPQVFVKGFLRQWAHATNGNEQELQALYRQAHHTQSHAGLFTGKAIRLPFLISRKVFFIIPVFVACVVILGYIFYNQSITDRNPQVEITSPTEIEIITAKNFIHLSGNTRNVESLTINGKLVATNKGGRFGYIYTLEQGENTILFVAKNKQGSEIEIIRKVRYENF